jgi:hypothetical protein
MKQPARVVLNVVAVLSLALFLLCLYAWPRSYFPRRCRVESGDGRLLVVFWEGMYPPRGMVGGEETDPADARWIGGSHMWKRLAAGGNPSSDELWCLGFGTLRGSGFGTLRYHLIAIPFWFLLLAAGSFPAYWIFWSRRQRLRAKEGRCQKCGYDLRATPERCPECGLTPAEKLNTTSN